MSQNDPMIFLHTKIEWSKSQVEHTPYGDFTLEAWPWADTVKKVSSVKLRIAEFDLSDWLKSFQ